jgi:glycosyltransferase involved in cell wall biosynthesis
VNLVLYTHPEFLALGSQNHFARMLADAFRARGHHVDLRRPQPMLRAKLTRGPLAKWAGYVDQYLLFPLQVRAGMRRDPQDTLYVFCDQALGPWVPLAAHRPHVVHCHDLLALRSALGDIPENPTSSTGRIYQRYIRRGFRRARHFISISARSRDDLHRFGDVEAVTSEVVYNGLNHPFRPLNGDTARRVLHEAGIAPSAQGCLLHVGGGQWYKNSAGVVALYACHVRESLRRNETPLPLWMLSPPPDAALADAIAQLPAGGEVRFLRGLAPHVLEALYAHARALLFPSLAEGFGWPIAEAMACGCPVVTTGEAPMTEVGGEHATYLRRPSHGDDLNGWAEAVAPSLHGLLQRSPLEAADAAHAARVWAARFDAGKAIDRYLVIYQRILSLEAVRTTRTAAP